MKIDAKDCLRDLAIIERRVADAARLGIVQSVKVAYRNARDTTLFNDQTGELRGTIDIIDVGAYKQRLIWRAKHARYLTEGTRGHGPTTSPVMRFQIGGRWISARYVQGVDQRPFDVSAAAAGSQAMSVIMNEGAQRAVEYP